MVESLLDPSEEVLLDTPYLRRIRQQGRAEGLIEGKAEGLAEGKGIGLAEGLLKGKEAGLAEGKEVGLIEGLREAILEAITLRFNPSAREYRQLGQRLEAFTDRKVLQEILVAAIEVEDMASFTARLPEVSSGS